MTKREYRAAEVRAATLYRVGAPNEGNIMRVFQPLREDHPLVQDRDVCPLCKKYFAAGERTMLAPAREPIAKKFELVPAIPVHASCALKGAETKVGIIARIKDGDGSPYPVVTESGKQFSLEDVGL